MVAEPILLERVLELLEDINGVLPNVGGGGSGLYVALAGGAGAQQDVMKGLSISTYARVGSATPPNNVTAGDLTVNRISVGNLHTFGNAGSGLTLDIASTTTATIADVYPQNRQAWTIAPESNSGSYNFQNYWIIDLHAPAGVTNNWIANFVGDNLHHQTGAIDSIFGMNFVAIELDGGSPATAGAITNLYGAYLRPMYNPGGASVCTVTNVWGLQIEPNLRFGTGTFTVGTYRGIHLLGPASGAVYTTFVQLEIAAVSGATNNIGIRNAASLLQSGNVGFFTVTTPVGQRTSGANLTNSVTSGGSSDVIADFTSLTVYATDAPTIRNDIYQLARKLQQINDGLRALGLFT